MRDFSFFFVLLVGVFSFAPAAYAQRISADTIGVSVEQQAGPNGSTLRRNFFICENRSEATQGRRMTAIPYDCEGTIELELNGVSSQVRVGVNLHVNYSKVYLRVDQGQSRPNLQLYPGAAFPISISQYTENYSAGRAMLQLFDESRNSPMTGLINPVIRSSEHSPVYLEIKIAYK